MHTRSCRGARCLWHPEFLFEAALLGGFMVSALAFTIVLEHPDSPARAAIPTAWLRRAVIGAGMGATAVVLIYSRWGQRSGAHLNPAVTLAFTRLGLLDRATALGYVAAQFGGGLAGVGLGRLMFGSLVEHPSVRYAVTTPDAGLVPAFAAELAMTTALMSAVLAATRREAWRPRAGLIAAASVAVFITVAAPVSGMSLNPARTLASALWAGEFRGWWIYFLAPALGMLLAAEIARPLHPNGKDPSCGITT